MLSNEILLLKIIDSNSSLSMLRDRGLSYSQVVMLIKKQEVDGNINITDKGIFLTNQGEKILEENISKVLLRKKDQWILPQEHLYKQSISFNQIILPKNSKL